MASLSTTTDLAINILSQEKYDQLKLSGLLEPYQLYFTDNVFLDAEGEQIKNVGSPILSSDAATKGYVDNKVSSIHVPTDLSAFTNSPGYLTEHQSLSNYYQKSETSGAAEISSALSSKAEVSAIVPAFFRNVQLSKPESAGHRMHFRADVAKDGQFQDVALNGFDTATGQNRLKVRYFAADGLSGTWREMDAEGLYTDAEDAPVAFMLAAALSAAGEIPTLSSQYFVRYIWYWTEGGAEHRSDQYSVAVPSNTAAGVCPGDVARKTEFAALEQQVNPDKDIVGLDQEYGEYYTLKTGRISELSGGMEGEFKLLLDAYRHGSPYTFQFRTGEISASPSFYVDLGNGPEYASGLSANSGYSFPAGGVYSATLQGDVLRVHEFGYTGTAKGGIPSRYALVSKVPGQAGSALSVQIDDRTITTVGISDSTDISVYLPEKPDDGGARDFIVRFEISSSTAPGFTFIGLDESFQFDTDDDDWAVMEPGLNIVSFTETK